MAAKMNLTIDAGATFPTHTFHYREADGVTPVDGLDGWTARFQARRVAESTGDPDFDAEPVWDAALATATLDFTSAQTGAMASGDYFYAIEISHPDGEPVIRLVEGRVRVTPEVVR